MAVTEADEEVMVLVLEGGEEDGAGLWRKGGGEGRGEGGREGGREPSREGGRSESLFPTNHFFK